MGAYLSGSYSLLPWPTSARRGLRAIRRLVATDRTGLFTNRSRPVTFSPLAHALVELERIQIAAGGPASLGGPSCAPGRVGLRDRVGRRAFIAAALRRGPDARNERTGG